jgi:ketosteroid isomerase-like protein
MQRIQNLAIVRQAIDAYGRRDVEALRQLMSTDVELDWSASKGWFAGVYCGTDEVIRVFADYFSAFEAIAIEPESFVAAGDSVVVPNVAHLRGREGVEVSARATFVYTLRHGAVTRICLYQLLTDAAEAMDIAA